MMTAAEIVAAVLAWQADPLREPLVCARNRLHAKLVPIATPCGVMLMCPDCEYQQGDVPKSILEAGLPATNSEQFDYARDDVARLIRVRAKRPLGAADAVAIVRRQIAEAAWSYGVLYDLRTIEGASTRSDAHLTFEMVQRYVKEHGPRGRVAVVTREVRMLGVAQSYASQSARQGIAVQVFWNLTDAEDWLSGSP